MNERVVECKMKSGISMVEIRGTSSPMVARIIFAADLMSDCSGVFRGFLESARQRRKKKCRSANLKNEMYPWVSEVQMDYSTSVQANTNNASYHFSLSFLADEDRASATALLFLWVSILCTIVSRCIMEQQPPPSQKVKGKVGRRHRMFSSGRF